MSDPNFLRIGTKERDEALKALGEHFAEGRLPVSEYDDRVTKAIEAETRADVRPLFEDLPAPYPGFLAPTVPAVVKNSRYDMVTPSSSPRHKIAAGTMQIFLPFGIGRFYMGHNHIAVAQLVLAFAGIGILWCWIDGILLLANGGTDAEGRRLRG